MIILYLFWIQAAEVFYNLQTLSLFVKGTIKDKGCHGALQNQNKTENLNWSSVLRKGDILVEIRREDPLSIQCIYITYNKAKHSSNNIVLPI